MKNAKTHLTLATGAAAAVATLALSPAQAADNPFGMTRLDAGYQLAQMDKKTDGKCGGDKKADASCGADKKKDANCGADKKKDAACGADKKKDAACGADKKKDAACGASKK